MNFCMRCDKEFENLVMVTDNQHWVDGEYCEGCSEKIRDDTKKKPFFYEDLDCTWPFVIGQTMGLLANPKANTNLDRVLGEEDAEKFKASLKKIAESFYYKDQT